MIKLLNGGISKPRVLMLRQDKRYLVKVRMPGVDPEKMRIEVQNDRLFLFHDISIQNADLLAEKKPVPFNIGYVLIPFDVDIQKINALYEDHELQITLPFNKLAGGYRKNIDIDL